MNNEGNDVKTIPVPTYETNSGKEEVVTKPITTSTTFNDKSKEKN